MKPQAFLYEASSQLEIQQEASNAQSMCKGSSDHEYFEVERLILLAGTYLLKCIVIYVQRRCQQYICLYLGERYGAYMSEAQQMVSEFGQSVTLDYDQEEETDNDIPCSATLYLTGRFQIDILLLILSDLVSLPHPDQA